MVSKTSYQSIATLLGAILNRPVITVVGLQTLVQECLQVRKQQGKMALVQFAQSLPTRFLSTAEIELVQQDHRFPQLAEAVIALLVTEGVVRTSEAQLLSHMLMATRKNKANGKRKRAW